MARPTMSKTIYMQQLGRGTRKCEGKEDLLVFDFVDNANMFKIKKPIRGVQDSSPYVLGAVQGYTDHYAVQFIQQKHRSFSA